MISLVRVDDRLVHAQVVVGWIEFLRCRDVLVVDDTVAWDRDRLDLFRMVIPQEIRLDAVDVRDLAEQSPKIGQSEKPYLLLFANPLMLAAAVDLGFRPRVVNLGGMHESPGRHSWLHGLFASDLEIAAIRRMIGMGIEFEIRTVPAAKPREVSGDL